MSLRTMMGAVIADATRIIAVDVRSNRLELAGELGATDVVDASRVDPLEEIRRPTDGGVRYIIEASGSPQSLSCGIKLLKTGGPYMFAGAKWIRTAGLAR